MIRYKHEFFGTYKKENSDERQDKCQSFLAKATQYAEDDPLVKDVRWIVLRTLYAPVFVFVAGLIFIIGIILLLLLIRKRMRKIKQKRLLID